MNSMDWWDLFPNTVWGAGLLVVVAALGTTGFRAWQEGVRFRQKLSEPSFLLPFDLGMFLVCMSLLLAGGRWWVQALWGMLAATFAVHFLWLWRGARVAQAADEPLTADARPSGRVSRERRGDLTFWLGWGLLLAGLLVLTVWAGVTTVQLVGRVQSLQSHLHHLERLGKAGGDALGLAELESSGAHLSGMREDVEAIQGLAGPLSAAGPLLRWVPEYGGDLAAAADLLEVAMGVTSSAEIAYQALHPAAELLATQQDGVNLAPEAVEQLLPVLTRAQAELRTAREELRSAEGVRSRLDTESLSPHAAGLLQQVDGYLPRLETALDVALLAPILLSADSADADDGVLTYLILAQNDEELRATGGFITGVGELAVETGRVTSLHFSDSYAVDNLEEPHAVTPADFQQTLFGQLWFFRDANWDADFPTSARRALEIYARDRGVQADGVFALDLTALELLVDAVGPLRVEGIGQPVTRDSVVEVIQAQWSETAGDDSGEWRLRRKDFMGQIAGAALESLISGQGVEPLQVFQALHEALSEKHILIYSTDPLATDLLSRRGWDGALPVTSASTPSSDLLAVVDSNVGFNKVDGNIERNIAYQVDLGDKEDPRARLTLTYHNHSRRPVEVCVQESRYGDTYADMMNRCYWDYVRVYVPAGSELLMGPEPSLPSGSLLARRGSADMQGPVSPTLNQGSWTLWTAFFDLAPGAQRTLTFEYRLPAGLLERDPAGILQYRLRVQKQPGTQATPLQVKVLLPPNAELIKAVPPGLPLVSTDLRTDREFVVRYREGIP